MIDEIRKIKSTRKELREFGLTVGIILVILGLVAMWRGKASWPYLAAVGSALAAFGAIAPEPLKPLQKAWMALALVMGFFMSRVILILLFYLVVTPIGLMTRLFGKDILDERIRKDSPSYWIKRIGPEKTKESYENQY